GNRKTIVHLGALQIARGQVCHAKSVLSCSARDRKRWRIFFVERQVIGGMSVAEQSGGLAPIATDLVQIFSRNENDRSRAVGDLRTIRNFKRWSNAWILVRNLRCAIERKIGLAHLRQRVQ